MSNISQPSPVKPVESGLYDNDIENYSLYQLPLLDGLRRVYRRLYRFRTWSTQQDVRKQVFDQRSILDTLIKNTNEAKEKLDQRLNQGLYVDLSPLKTKLGDCQKEIFQVSEFLKALKMAILSDDDVPSNPYSAEQSESLSYFSQDQERFTVLMTTLINSYNSNPTKSYFSGTQVYCNFTDKDKFYPGRIMTSNFENNYNYMIAGCYTGYEGDGKTSKSFQWTWNSPKCDFNLKCINWDKHGKGIAFLPQFVEYENQVVGCDELKKWYEMLNLIFV